MRKSNFLLKILNHRFNEIFEEVRYNVDITNEEDDTMNLKEAFRFQNKIEHLLGETEHILSSEDCVTLTKRTYLYKKANPDAENETVTIIPDTEYYQEINKLVEFAMYLLEKREELSKAITETKRKLPIDLNGETSLNSYRQKLSEIFRDMAKIKGKEVTETNGGLGYRFNNEGNQVSYRCDVEKVTTINFDRNVVRKYAAQLSKTADIASIEIDRCIINYEVDFEPPFDVNDSFDEVFENFNAG